MSIRPFLYFRTIQSGDPVRISFDGATGDLDATFRAFSDEGDIVIVTTPIGEQDVSLQTVHYVDNYTQVRSPIPVELAGVGGIEIGDTVVVRFTGNGPGAEVTGILTEVDKYLGIVVIDDEIVCKDFWTITKIN